MIRTIMVPVKINENSAKSRMNFEINEILRKQKNEELKHDSSQSRK